MWPAVWAGSFSPLLRIINEIRQIAGTYYGPIKWSSLSYYSKCISSKKSPISQASMFSQEKTSWDSASWKWVKSSLTTTTFSPELGSFQPSTLIFGRKSRINHQRKKINATSSSLKLLAKEKEYFSPTKLMKWKMGSTMSCKSTFKILFYWMGSNLILGCMSFFAGQIQCVYMCTRKDWLDWPLNHTQNRQKIIWKNCACIWQTMRSTKKVPNSCLTRTQTICL